MPGRKVKAKPKAKAPQKQRGPAAPPEQEPQPVRECPVVGFGASAGGLEAFTEVLKHVPKNPGIAMVLVQHLDPKHTSILTELLSRATSLPVLEIREGVHVESNHAYVIPPNTNLTISGGVLHLEPRGAGPHMPIDSFFRSLAEDQGNKAIGVILSGTASDGTLGMKAIKAGGGITFAQNIESAKYDGMPRSAIAAGCVDFVLPPEQLAREIIRLCHHPYVNGDGGARGGGETALPGEESAFKEIFSMLRSATGVDFSYYKPGTIRRRTLRRMALQKFGKFDEYLAYLKANRGELQLLFQDILINVTGFFREASTYEVIRSRVLPAIFKERPPDEAVRVWVPGCSTGEEVYSIAICLIEYMRDMGIEAQLQIFGTDLSDAALEKARAGFYPDTIASEVSLERLRRFFVPVNGSYQITRSVRDSCVFARQNVTKDPPFSKLDLIICRNVLIYLGPVLQTTALRLFHYALRSNGFLVLGHSESVGAATDHFAQIDKQHKIYSKKTAPSAILTTDLGAYQGPVMLLAPPAKAPDRPAGTDIQRRVDQIILAQYSPSAIIIDSGLHILQFRGQLPTFLSHSPGDTSLDLNKMLPTGLGLEIRKLVRKAESNGTAVKSGPVIAPTKVGMFQVTVSVAPIQTSPEGLAHFLVVFEEAALTRTKPTARGSRGVADVTVRGLEQELATTKEYLQTVIEEQEAATEELKSAHEEVQSANEELQSTNEELLTAKEELQSTNEELTTVNEEMQNRNMELQQINNDVLNLLSSVNIPIIMLGNDLRIRRFTPQAEKILNLLPADAGRLISDFRLKISLTDLAALCRDVVDNLTPKQRDVQDSDGRTYSLWIRPYRTAENRIDGVVLSMFDVTERRHSAEARYRRLFEAAPDGIVIADAHQGEILDVNPFTMRLFGYPKSELVGRRFWETPLFEGTAISQDMLSRLRDTESIQAAVSLRSESGGQVETEVLCSLYDEADSQVVQFNIRDLTGKRRLEEQSHREEMQVQQRHKLEAVGRLAGGVAHDFNNLLMAMLGYSDLLAQEIGINPKAQAYLEEIRASGGRAALLTKQLLAFGRKQIISPEVLDVNEVITEMKQLMNVTLSEKIELVSEVRCDPCLVRADRGQLEQVLLNLVLNARDAMPSGGKITVSTANVSIDRAFSERHPVVPAGEYVTLTVQDTGTGMDPQTQSHIFEPFFTTKPKGKGVGLGLATVYSIVRDSGGYIWAYSELGIGTTFTVYLPKVSSGSAGQETAVEKAAVNDPHGTETILIAEDEPAVRSLAHLFLEQRGYYVLEASSGREALNLANEYQGPIHLLLTDVVMPQMSGRELAFLFSSRRPDLNVLYMSGHTEDAIIHHGVLDEGVAFLQKPFTPVQLAIAVREVLDKNKL